MDKTNIAIKSTVISILIFLIQGVLTFWRTSVIINQYGVNVNSIVQASTDVFSYLILLESGLGAAYLFKMYEPLAEKNLNKVYSLYLGLERKLKHVAMYMALALLVISFIYPLLLEDNEVAYIEKILIILILGLRFIFPYYFTVAKKNLLKAEEKQYQVTFIDGLINSVILFGEILLARWVGVRIELALSIGLIVIVISYFLYEKIIEKNYKSFSNNDITPSYDGDEMTNDIIIHQIASLANSHIDVFILSLFNLSAVTTYSAYNLAISYPTKLVSKVIENIRASIGLKLTTKDDNIFSVFREIISVNYYIVAITIPVFVVLINDFITLWIGEEFLLGVFSIVMFGLIMFHRLTINLIYIVRDGRGLYKESKVYTVVTAITNSVLSIILAYFYGINGLLFATVLTSYLIMDYGNLKLVYNKIFNKSLKIVLQDYVSLFSLIIFTTTILRLLLNYIISINSDNWSLFSIKSILTIAVSLIINTLFMVIFNHSFYKVLKRLTNKLK